MFAWYIVNEQMMWGDSVNYAVKPAHVVTPIKQSPSIVVIEIIYEINLL